MENFVVSARKYRPISFSSVVGQQSLTTTLKNAIQRNQLAQAYLFCGPRGVGKTTCARIFAKTINCLNITPDFEACNECESCKAFISQRSFNIHELDAASNSSVEGIRNLIEQVRVPPQIGKYSVYIIDEVHMLSQAAFNAFLKTLEEPPAHAIFILATTEKHKIIPTILSRCQIFDFNRIRVEDIVKFLQDIAAKEGVNYEIEALNIIAQKAEGAMRDALSIFDQVVNFSENNITYQKVIENLNVLDYQYYFSLTENFLAGEYPAALNVFDELLSKGFDMQQFINGLSTHFRNLLICKDPQTAPMLEVGAAIAENYVKVAQKCTPEFLIEVLGIINQTDISFKHSSNQRLHVELMLISLCGINQLKKKVDTHELTESEGNDLIIVAEAHSDTGYQTEKPVKQAEETQQVATQRKPQPKTISIKSAILGKEGQDSETGDSDDACNVAGMGDETCGDTVEAADFTLVDLETYWQEYIDKNLSEKPAYASLLELYKPDLGENFSLTITFETQLQLDMFLEIKSDLMHYLKIKLENKLITFTEKIQEGEVQQNKLYTIEDKYRFLSQKNPALSKLRQQLNLDFE
ncbi:MAG TPA: DNA polymerase III subunit gamma/tau [Tenuifilaceae bacterium]|jgi:DNA polymerase-3 subunit gamma/tau|nr:DNA polymerase III subunit gamma/tau [Bacteroidales bacterium]MDI9516766.1 DNA polymerase III subunit gamma/tau [Bacteroidota bacterium]NLH56788.1 DNA polymerase III subunit gamma/tau [Rikenellaceae bacterium]OQC62250.1 MAG: DNA polymerase III subunit tau [Bacteroidetes bacterium ADurb.Bin008]HNV82063.1 DNA polymerase III subunit gamma/tau [Tenuifilaceae bacterium]